MSGGLPYENTPPPGEPSQPAMASEPAMLDRALDDGVANATSAINMDMDMDPLDRPLDDYRPPKPDVPDHVKDLMGRMGQGKVYLLDETPAILHHGQQDRIRGDPRIADLAEQLNATDPTEWLDAVTTASSSPVRHNALLVRSDLVKHLSTSKVFTWVSGLGATAMGIEWLNDTTLILLFNDAASALLGLSMLSKAGFNPSEGDDPLLERAAHSIPYSLLPQVEPSAVGRSGAKGGEELLPGSGSGTTDGVRRRGRGAFADRTAAETEASEGRLILTSGAGGVGGASDSSRQWSFAEGVDPNARIGVRFAVLADKELRQEAKKSEWYAKHGRNAGKERAAGGRANRADRYEEMYSWQDGANGGGGDDDGSAAATEGREFRKRIGRERRPDRRDDGPRSARGGGGGGRRTAEDLDLELERMARRREREDKGLPPDEGEDARGMDMDEVGDPARRSRYGGGRLRDGRKGPRGGDGRRPARGKDDLDRELDNMFAARSATTS